MLCGRRPAQQRSMLERFGLQANATSPTGDESMVRPHGGNPFPKEARLTSPDTNGLHAGCKTRRARKPSMSFRIVIIGMCGGRA